MIEPKTTRTIGPQLPSSSRLLDFGGQLGAFAKKVGLRMSVVHKGTSIKLFNSIVYDTPVDTGVARGGWNPSMGAVKWAPSGRRDTSGALTAKDIEVTITGNYNQIAFLSNAVKYIVPLEYGWSLKSPEGMVRINVTRFQQIIRETVAAAKREVK
jgi:hypothetical protein